MFDACCLTISGRACFPDPYLSIAKSGAPNPVLVGDTITYTYTISNAGPQDSQSVRLHDTLPAGISFAGFGTVTGGGICVFNYFPSMPATLDCLWNSLASGDSVQAQINVSADQAGTVTNTATVTSDTTPDPTPSNDAATAIVTIKEQTSVPEFPTILMPIAAVMSLFFLIQRRKGK
ncbi:MAG TPA: DUF11 domain-containing protein [Candidatus Methanoperedenaceae archaeon]|nr:DUF11 domain-containing protein [Candidatus Methanoperedenaceae archaeon]